MESELRKRKKQKNGDEPVTETKVSVKRSETIDKTFTRLIVFILLGLLLLLTGINVFPEHNLSLKTVALFDNLLNKCGLAPKMYAVILDAGSTGSRVLAFTFHKNPVTSDIVLEDELFAEVKPGLSSFADSPGRAAAAINELLEKARSRIPEEDWNTTPVALKATAGLRLLPQDKSQAIINEVKEVMTKSGFLIVNEESSVEIMAELDEGLFGWFTINFLFKKLNKLPKSYVALDLGGGSTQITFAPKWGSTLLEAPPEFLHDVAIFKEKIPIYSRSYLGLGLMAAREAIFLQDEPAGSTSVSSPCMVTPTPTPWEFHGKHYAISSAEVGGYEKCVIAVHKVIGSLGVHPPEEMPIRKIAAFSYFYDRAVDSGIMEKGRSGVVEVQDFINAAKVACHDPSQPFLCVDLTFISSLLHHGYRLSADAKLGLYKNINGHETSWALGAAFALLEKVK